MLLLLDVVCLHRVDPQTLWGSNWLLLRTCAKLLTTGSESLLKSAGAALRKKKEKKKKGVSTLKSGKMFEDRRLQGVQMNVC